MPLQAPLMRPGGSTCWNDLAFLPDGRVAWVGYEAPYVVALLDGHEAWRVKAPEGFWYLKCGVSPSGQIAAVAQGQQSGHLVTIIHGGSAGDTKIGCIGQNGCGVYWDESLQSFVALTMEHTTTAARVALPSGRVLERIAVPNTSQGFRTVHPDGTWVWGDATMRQTVRGWPLSELAQDGAVLVGQQSLDALPPGLIVATNDRVFRAWTGDCREPRVVVRGESIAVSCRVSHVGAALVRIDPPYPAAESPIVVRPLPSPVWCGYFKAISDSYGDASLPGNCTVVETAAEAQRSTLPIIATQNALLGARARWASTAAVYTEAGSAGALSASATAAQAAVRQAGLAPRPILGVCDGFQPVGPIAGVDWIGIEAYAEPPNEPTSAVVARVKATLARLPQTQAVALIAMAYDRNGAYTDLAQLVAMQATWPELVRSDARIKALLWFSA